VEGKKNPMDVTMLDSRFVCSFIIYLREKGKKKSFYDMFLKNVLLTRSDVGMSSNRVESSLKISRLAHL
jgi:hypothetical protein